MKRNMDSYPTKVSWEHCFICQTKHTEGLKTCKILLENLANNVITFWTYGKLELNWEALTELNENGEPNFYDSFIKHDVKFHCKCGKRFDNQKMQRLMKSQKKSKESESSVFLSSQQKMKFDSLFCAICSEDDFDYNLHASGSLHATQTEINTVHNRELTIKSKEMTAKVGNLSLLSLLAQEDLASNKIYYHRQWYNDMVRSCEKLETDESIMDVKWKKAAIFDSTILDAEAESPSSSFAAREINSMYVEQLQIHGIQEKVNTTPFTEKDFSWLVKRIYLNCI